MNAPRKHEKYERLLAHAKSLPPVPTAVAHPCDASSLTATVEAAEAGLIKPILVGPLARIDAFIPAYTRYGVPKPVLEHFSAAEHDHFNAIGYTIGGLILWPATPVDRKWTINQARGCLRSTIGDRMDLTLESIRRHYQDEWSPLADVLARSPAPCYVVSEQVAEEVTGFHVHRGALASMRRTPLRSVEEVVAGARTVVVLEDVVDHANVGAVIRSSAALGVDAIVLSPRCADPLYRRSVKVSMGAVFTLPYARLGDWYDGVAELAAAGLTTVALTPAADAVDVVRAVHGLRRVALLLGSEGAVGKSESLTPKRRWNSAYRSSSRSA